MSGGGNADTKRGEKKMEGEDSVRTVDCLRGRLLAERVASRNAKDEAEQLGNKLMELENLLKQEARSRNRAEKKLKFLMKKLESMNISYVSDESEYSGLVDKSDISSISSTTSSRTKEQQQENNENQQTKISKVFETQESKGNATSQKESENLQQNDSQNCLFSLSDDSSTTEGTSISAFEVNLPELKGQKCETGRNEDPRSPTVSEIIEQNIAQNATVEDSLSSSSDEHFGKSSSKMDEQSDICYHSIRSSADEGLNEEDDQDQDSEIDNSMALVLVDTPQKNHTIDPEVLDATVKEVLDTLRRVKEQLLSSMERRRINMVKVG